MKKRTHQEFIEKLAQVNPNIEVVDFYVNNQTKLKVKDKKCGHIFLKAPCCLLNGKGCPKCSIKETGLKKIVSLDKMLLEIETKYPGLFEYIDGYTRKTKKCKWRCKICKHEWENSPSNILQGNGCPVCAINRKITSQIMPLPEMLEQLKKVHGNDIVYLEGYKGMNKKCKFMCTIDGYIWWTIPDTIINRGSGCPMCGRKRISEKQKTSLNEMLARLNGVHGDAIIYIEGFVNIRTKCKWRCKYDGYEWYTTPDSILNQKTGCPLCSNHAPISLEEFLNRVKEISKGTIQILTPEKFKDSRSIIDCQCKLDNCTWSTYAFSVYTGHCKCPRCVASSLEKPIYDLLTKKHCLFDFDEPLEGCKVENSTQNLRPDFLFKNYPLVFELDGAQHIVPMQGYESFEKTKKYDEIKNNYLKNNNYILIRAVADDLIKNAHGNYISISKLKELIEIGISDNGEVNLEIFRPYDFNRN